MNKQLVIFDFDGTIGDTSRMAVDMLNQLARKYHFREILPEDEQKLRDKSSRELVRYLNIPLVKAPFVLREGRALMSKQIDQVSPVPGMEEVLGELAARGYELGILTSNSENNVRRFLTMHGMDELFSFVHSEFNLFGKHTVLRKIAHTRDYEPRDMVYIGDETRDARAALKAGVTAVAVTWGINSRVALERAAPQYIVDRPHDLLDILRGK